MTDIAGTMPEAKHRSTKKRVQAVVRSTPPSHRVHVTVDPVVKQAAAVETPKVVKVKRTPGEQIASWWPVAVGVFLCGFVPEWHAMAAQAGEWVMRFAFPLSMIATGREIGIDPQMTSVMPQLTLFIQLPLEGLLTKITLDRGRSLKSAIVQLFLVHAVAAFVLWLITFGPK